MKTKEFKGEIIILAAAVIYGLGFVAQSEGNAMGPWSYSAGRYIIGALALMPLAVFLRNDNDQKERAMKMPVREMLPGTIAMSFGLLVTVLLQQYALMYTTVAKTAFITSLYVILVPVGGVLFFRRKISRRVFVGAGVAMAGVYLISLAGGIKEMNKGDIMLLVSAVISAMFFFVMEYYAARADAASFTCLMFLGAGLMFIPGALILEDCTVEMIKETAIPLLYGGICICAAGYTLQMIGMKYVPAERATIILSLETIVSLFAGRIILHETMNIREYVGCALIFLAVILSETGKNDNKH